MKNIYILCGLIGSGKSTWAKNFVKNRKDTVIVNKDSIREMLKGQYNYTPNLEPLVKEIAEYSYIKALDSGFNVVIDETNITKEKRKYWVKLPEQSEIYDTKFIIVYFSEKENNIENRMKSPKGISEKEWQKVYESMLNSFEKPTEDEGEIIEVKI